MSNHDNEDNQPSLSMSSTHATSDEAPPSYESVVFGGVSTDDSNINCGNYFRECDEIIPLSELDRRNGQCNPDSIRKNSFEPCLTTTNIRIDLTVTENSRRLPESARKSHDRREGRTEHVRFTRVSERESSRSSRSSRSRSQQESGDIERADVESDPESTSIAEDRQFSSNMCFSIIICLCCNPLCGLFAIACSSMSDVAKEQGNIQMAREHSNRAFMCGILGIFTTMATVGGILASGVFNTRFV